MEGMKGIILAGGYGTRFHPVTKTIPKEMIPLVNVPAIHFIIEEFMEAGIKDIIIISHRNKKSMEDYFDRLPELENFFNQTGNFHHLSKIKPYDLNVAFIRQREMTGPGDALLLAKPFIGNTPFIVAFPDDVIMSKTGLSLQMAQIYQEFKLSILALMEIEGDVSRYGVVSPGKKINDKVFYFNGMIEKPKPGTEPSKIISIGRYLFEPEILEILSDLRKKHISGEFYLTGGIAELAKQNKTLGYFFEGKRLDIGTPEGYIEAFLEYVNNKTEYKNILDKLLIKSK